MSGYHQLSTEQYVNQAAAAEAKELRAAEQREAMKSMLQFGFAVSVLGVSMLAVYTMPKWLPEVSKFLEGAGILTS